MSSTTDDLTTRARIRDAAIEVFATTGFQATVRRLADAAGVSPGLIIHHFGSKAGLRAECDDIVLTTMIDDKRDIIGPGARYDEYLAELERDPRRRTQVVYLLRALAEGGEVARAVIERSIERTQQAMERGVAEGMFRPSFDEAARARYLTYTSLGALLMDTVTHPPADWSDPVAILRGYIDRIAGPSIEYAAHGAGVDPEILDTYLDNRPRQGEPT